MSARSAASILLLAGILLSGHRRVSAADPAPKPPVPKPRMVPRPVPGLSNSSPKAASRPATPAAPAASVPSPASAAGPAPDQARILMIYRRGTFPLPPADPALSASGPVPARNARPAPAADPRPGHVRIITKAEADMLSAQPHP